MKVLSPPYCRARSDTIEMMCLLLYIIVQQYSRQTQLVEARNWPWSNSKGTLKDDYTDCTVQVPVATCSCTYLLL